MKIAICISGQPRSYEAGFYELKKHFLDKYDCDVYFHTWKDTNIIFQSIHNFTETRNYTFTEEDYQNILELYQPKDYIFQKPIEFDRNDIKGEHIGIRLNSILSYWLSTKFCFDLIKKSQIKYDLVVKTRFDLQFTDVISPECPLIKDLTQLDPNHFYCFDWEYGSASRPAEVDDIYSVSSFEIADIYCQLASYILSYCYVDKEFEEWLSNKLGGGRSDKIISECMLRYHLEKNNVSIKQINSGNHPKHWTAKIIR